MKKLTKILILLVVLFSTCGCSQKESENLNILTTVYPINYIINEIYKEGNVTSIYPDGADISNYSLTDKQVEEYSKNNIFIYNGLSNEQTIAKNLINKNKKLNVIDVAYGLKYTSGMEELWLSPNYFIMLATTIKDNLKDFTNSNYINEEIEKNYKELEETLSLADAKLRSISENAKAVNKNTIIVSSNVLKFLENYGFKVISLEDKEYTSTINQNNIKSHFKNGTYTTLFMKDNDQKTDLIKSLETTYNAKIITVSSLNTISKEQREENENYLTIMNKFISEIEAATTMA